MEDHELSPPTTIYCKVCAQEIVIPAELLTPIERLTFKEKLFSARPSLSNKSRWQKESPIIAMEMSTTSNNIYKKVCICFTRVRRVTSVIRVTFAISACVSFSLLFLHAI